MGLYICGFPSGSTGAVSQEIVLEYPGGYRAIGFRVEKKTRSPAVESGYEKRIRGDVSARTKNKKDREGGKAKCTRQEPEIPGRSTLTPGIYLDLKRLDRFHRYITRSIGNLSLKKINIKSYITYSLFRPELFSALESKKLCVFITIII